MQGFVIVVVGIGLMYLVLSGKLDCIIASFRACSGSGASGAKPSGVSAPVASPATPTIAALDNVMSYERG